MFKHIRLKDWRQFDEINIDFHEHLTVLTGANGAGKTTILNILSECIGWKTEFVSSYGVDESGKATYWNGIKRGFNKLIKMISGKADNKSNSIGELVFGNNVISELTIPNVNGGTYSIVINPQHKEKGVYINSHRPNFSYHSIKHIPTEISTREIIYNQYDSFNKLYLKDTFRDHSISFTSLIKETLMALAIFGEGNDTVKKNTNIKAIFDGYIDILKVILPKKLGFKKISVVIPEVLICTDSGEFPIDAVSGGISSLINIAWQLYMFADRNEKFVAIIDEPENHLHPELQKNFLGNFIKAFPNVQFIIATHNPFMITSQKDSNVYVLNYNDEKKVYSQKLDYINKAGTSNEILRNVLGIESTMPTWAERELQNIIKKYSEKDLTNDSLSKLKVELNELGLGEYIPETISQIVR